MANINSQLQGRTPRGKVILRHPKWADYADWVELRRSNKEFLSPWEPLWDDNHLTRPSYRSRLTRFKKMVTHDEGYPFHIFQETDKKIIGACNITHIERGISQSAKLGYWVGQQYARQGYARASVRAASRFCFDELGLHRIEAAVRPDNKPSILLLESQGFQREGLARGYLKIDGQWHDHIIYARLSSDHYASTSLS